MKVTSLFAPRTCVLRMTVLALHNVKQQKLPVKLHLSCKENIILLACACKLTISTLILCLIICFRVFDPNSYMFVSYILYNVKNAHELSKSTKIVGYLTLPERCAKSRIKRTIQLMNFEADFSIMQL